MNARLPSHTLYDDPVLAETEFALAISPCPRIDESKDPVERSDFAPKYSTSEPHGQNEKSPETDSDKDELTDTLTVGWAIALAIAVAVVIHVSGG